MIPRLAFCAILIGLLFSVPAKSQEQSKDFLGAWYVYNGFFKFSPGFEFFFETQLRNYEIFSNTEAFFFRPYFTYNVNKNFQLGASTEYHKHFTFSTVPEEKISRDEFRIGLQAIVNQTIQTVHLQHRYRHEFRNINSSGGHRLRYRIQATIPITQKTLTRGTIFLNTNNEIFINNKPGWEFDQNRFFAAPGYYFTDNLNLQVGYMLVSKTGFNNHRIQVFLTQKFKFFQDEDQLMDD